MNHQGKRRPGKKNPSGNLSPQSTEIPVLVLHNLDPTWPSEEISQVTRQVHEMEDALREHGHPVRDVPIQDTLLSVRLLEYHPDDHVVLNWCEGLPGILHSEALVAQTLETMGFVYTGSTPRVLAASWDKRLVKRLLVQAGVPTPRWRVCETPEQAEWDRFPAIVKPVYEHCSLGVTTESVVLDGDGLRDRIGYVVESFRQPALVEDFIDGREFHVTLWGNGATRMLPAAEMDFSAFDDVRDRLCTFDSKFSPGSRHYESIRLRMPAPLSSAEEKALRSVALAAYRAVGCRDYARMDVRLRDDVFYVLDVNPNPDISADTSTASAAEAAGYTYGAMLNHLIHLAASRHPIFGEQMEAADLVQARARGRR